MLIAPRTTIVSATTAPAQLPVTPFPIAPEGWHLWSSNAKNDLVHGYVGAVLVSPTGDMFIGTDGRWSLLDDMYRALLASAAR